MKNDECGAVGGMRFGKGPEVLARKPAQCNFVHQKSYMT
jgi:hypothetical protein